MSLQLGKMTMDNAAMMVMAGVAIAFMVVFAVSLGT